MKLSGGGDSNPASVLETLLLGLLCGLVLVDVALLAESAAKAVPAGPVRLLLAVGAFGAVGLALALGVVHSQRYAVGAVVSLPLVVLYAFTGLLLPWTQLSYYLGQTGLELVLGVPYVGEPLAVALFGGFTLSAATLQAAFRYHYAVVALGVIGVLADLVSRYRRRSARTGRFPAGESD